MPAISRALWEELHGNLRGFIGRRVRNPEDVDDLVQRVLLQIHKGLGSLRDSDRLHAWVYRTARNAISDYYRAPGRRREGAAGAASDIADGAPIQFEGTDTEDESAAFVELARCIRPLLRQLPTPYVEALTLTEIEGVSQADAARRAGVSVSGMKSRVQRGRRQLRAVLEECCRVDLDRRGGVVAYEGRENAACGGCAADTPTVERRSGSVVRTTRAACTPARDEV